MAIKTNLKTMTPRRQAYKQKITLPSHGYSNPTAWPNGEITVYPWDSDIDEYLLTLSRQSGPKHLMLFQLVEKLCDLNGGSIGDFVAEETNIVLLVARSLSQDGTITYMAKCPQCHHTTPEQIRVPDELAKHGEKSLEYPGYDEITLPVCGDILRIRPLLVQDEKMVLNREEPERKTIPDNCMRNLLRIVTINDTTADTVFELKAWLEALSPKDIKFFSDKAQEYGPRLNTAIPHVCEIDYCRFEFKKVLTFEQEFFL